MLPKREEEEEEATQDTNMKERTRLNAVKNNSNTESYQEC